MILTKFHSIFLLIFLCSNVAAPGTEVGGDIDTKEGFSAMYTIGSNNSSTVTHEKKSANVVVLNNENCGPVNNFIAQNTSKDINFSVQDLKDHDVVKLLLEKQALKSENEALQRKLANSEKFGNWKFATGVVVGCVVGGYVSACFFRQQIGALIKFFSEELSKTRECITQISQSMMKEFHALTENVNGKFSTIIQETAKNGIINEQNLAKFKKEFSDNLNCGLKSIEQSNLNNVAQILSLGENISSMNQIMDSRYTIDTIASCFGPFAPIIKLFGMKPLVKLINLNYQNINFRY